MASGILSTAIKANPTVSTLTNTVGAIQGYRNGETVSNIVKQRFVLVKNEIQTCKI